jgi:multidrug resistance efflux pump
MEEDNGFFSSGIKDVIGKKLPWLVTWGITLIVGILSFLIMGTYFIRIPERVESKIVITTKTLPYKVISKTSGQLLDLLVKENQSVVKNDILGIISNPTNIDHLNSIKNNLVDFHHHLINNDSVSKLYLNDHLELGELNDSYLELLKSYQDYTFFIKNNFQKSKIELLNKEVTIYKKLIAAQKEQYNILAVDFEIGNRLFELEKSLYDQGVIARKEKELEEKKFLADKVRLANTKIEFVNSEMQIQRFNKEAFEQAKLFVETKATLLQNLKQSSLHLHSQLRNWENKYIIKAPINGNVAFYKYWDNNQYVNVGDEVMTIIPANLQIYSYSYVPLSGIGKIREGQSVNIKLTGFPQEQFGLVKGKVKSISKIIRDGTFLVKIDLPNGLKTTYHNEISFSQEMEGVGVIVTNEQSLMEKLFYKFLYLANRN